MLEQAVRGPLLIPRNDGSVNFHRDGVIVGDDRGAITFAGDYDEWDKSNRTITPRASDGVMLPPLLDLHTHIPQHPIRGRFVDGVPDDAPGGILLAGLHRNVFPAEAKCHDRSYAERVIAAFAADTLSHGVVGGAAFMTVSASATQAALSGLSSMWNVGLVLMNNNCPEYLRTDEETLEADIAGLAGQFGSRLIMTDRFAVAVDTPLRKRGVALAARHGLRTQTHLNEQIPEKSFIESTLYPHSESYTDVYREDGLLQHRCILAHCVQMRPREWQIVADTGSVVAHCPSSNSLLKSGVMPLDELLAHKIDYAIATDVGASPTCSMLSEMRRFLQVHAGQTSKATPTEALIRSTVAPARILDLGDRVGTLAAGRPMSFIEVVPIDDFMAKAADEAILSILPTEPDRPSNDVARVTLNGRVVFERSATHA